MLFLAKDQLIFFSELSFDSKVSKHPYMHQALGDIMHMWRLILYYKENYATNSFYKKVETGQQEMQLTLILIGIPN